MSQAPKPVFNKGPIVNWCGECPYLKVTNPEAARCEFLKKQLDWYDYWVAACGDKKKRR